jgi:hypothetical protein
MWEKHFKNIRDFVPICRQLGYKGMVMTSWSTSGQYSPVFETEENIIDLYPIRHVYPISGFNMLLAAYTESLRIDKPLDIDEFVIRYAEKQYGLERHQAEKFWHALRIAPYQVVQGKVLAPNPISVEQLADSAKIALRELTSLKPTKNEKEFAHYGLMQVIRGDYLTYETIEAKLNSPDFDPHDLPEVVVLLKQLMASEQTVDGTFKLFNAGYLYPGELADENKLRDEKTKLLHDRLSRQK